MEPEAFKKKQRTCPICKSPVKGRSDKRFCTSHCKSIYHHTLRKVTNDATAVTDGILHRNRSILLELLGKNRRKLKVGRRYLDQKKFNYDYLTGFHTNKHGKTVHHVYDFSWVIFSDQEILILRSNPKAIKKY